MSVDSFKATVEQVLSQTAELTVSKVSAKAPVAPWLPTPATQPLLTHRSHVASQRTRRSQQGRLSP